ncbi:DUF397 domain-containing protein [Spirillospora sp. NPDC047279]|uniref:DUF397 domain-containing protein n=1 Tax=Spirillospora sp. NPDC047279 TaxID=3155478 RepID=UPI0033DE891E
MTTDPPATPWRKSTRSLAAGECVELARLAPRLTGLRDSKNATVVLRLDVSEARTFLDHIKAGRHDRP